MPELPEVETIARTLSPQVQGQHIHTVEVLLPKALAFGKEYLPVLRGARVQCVFRRAKVLLVGLVPTQENLALLAHTASPADSFPRDPHLPDCPLFLAFHLKMTGRFFVHPAQSPPLKHTRIIFTLDDGSLFFDDIRTFGYCRIMQPHDFTTWEFWQRLGPEPLTATPAQLAERLGAKKTSIKAALLDQSTVVGVGNIYADESLFRARIRPDSRASTLPHKKLLELAKALQEILMQAIRECGSSIRDYRDAQGNAGAFQNNFFVYGQKNAPCKVCGHALESCTLAGRTTVFCPHCQK